MARLCGIDIHPETLLFARIWLVEAHLLHLGKGMIDWEAKTVAHFMRDGQYFFKSFNMGDGAWIQDNCRVLSPDKVEEGARIMPACTTLPNEKIATGSIWAGIPGGPVGEVITPSVRRRHDGAIASTRQLLGTSSIKRSRRGLSQKELESKVRSFEEKMVPTWKKEESAQKKGSFLRRRKSSTAMQESQLAAIQGMQRTTRRNKTLHGLQRIEEES